MSELNMKHPDAVFGEDIPEANKLLVDLVDRLKVADVSGLTPPAQSRVAAAIAVAAQRLIADYGKLEELRADLNKAKADLKNKYAEIEARESSVLARETLAGVLTQTKEVKSRRYFWK